MLNKLKTLSPKQTIGAVLITVGLLIILSILGLRVTYNNALKPLSNSLETKIVVIEEGSSAKQIGSKLKEAGVIKAAWAFEWYVRNNDLRDELKAGTYVFRPNQSVQDITKMIAEGKIATDYVTILPNKRIDQIKKAFVDSGFKTADVERAFSPDLYKDHPALVDKPEGKSLEGYLYPETFQKTADTKPEQIIRLSLDEMQKRLSPEIRKAIMKQGLTPYEGIILASIVENEVNSPDDRAKVAEVFYLRLRQGIPLSSDATTKYGAILDGRTPVITYESAYNTYNHLGLPPTPISNVTGSSLTAVAYPASTDFLYFVSGDDGKTYFSRTLEEHQALTKKYCTKLCN